MNGDGNCMKNRAVLKRNFRDACFIVAIFELVKATECRAYIDPGAGSQLLQILLAAGLGVIFTARLWWPALRRVIRKLSGRNED